MTLLMFLARFSLLEGVEIVSTCSKVFNDYKTNIFKVDPLFLITSISFSMYQALAFACMTSGRKFKYSIHKNLVCVMYTACQPRQFVKLRITTRCHSDNALSPHPSFPCHVFPNLLAMQSDLWVSFSHAFLHCSYPYNSSSPSLPL